MTRMHRVPSLIAGGFIGLVALARLVLRLYNTHMLIDYSIWYLFYLVVPQVVDLTIAAVLLRGRRDRLAGCALALGALYVTALAPLLAHLVNTSTDVFKVMYTFTAFTVLQGLFYLLAALDCFLTPKRSLGKFRLLLPILPVLCFIGILAVDIQRYATLLDDELTLRCLLSLLRHGLPGLAAELLTGLGIALSLLIPRSTKELASEKK